jgi:hypothetical protein
MTTPAFGDLQFQLRAGAVTRAECDAHLSGMAVDALHVEDLCPYVTMDDMWNSPTTKYDLFSWTGDVHLTTAADPLNDPRNGKQSLRMNTVASPGDWASLEFSIKALPTAIHDAWLRVFYRFSSGYFDPTKADELILMSPLPGAHQVAELTYDANRTTSPNQLWIYRKDWNGSSWVSTDTPTGLGPADFCDGSWWEFICHIRETTPLVVDVDHYIRHADTTGYSHNIPVHGIAVRNAGDIEFYAGGSIIGTPWAARWYEVMPWEWADGAAHADPFGVGA